MSKKRSKNYFLLDIIIIFLSVLFAVFLVESGTISMILVSVKGLELWGSFVSGMFFTSAFTTPPAIAVLGEIARAQGIFSTAVLGGAGAVIGDLIIFRFIRDRFSLHLLELMRQEGVGKKFRELLRLKYFRWFTFLIGGLIIASPLPDELGVSLLGFSKMKLLWFVSISFIFNSIGILLIGIIALAL